MSEDWKASVESQLGRLHDGVGRLTGWLIAAVAGPLLAIIGLYVYNGTKFDNLSDRAAKIEVSQARLETKLDEATKKLDAIGERLRKR